MAHSIVHSFDVFAMQCKDEDETIFCGNLKKKNRKNTFSYKIHSQTDTYYTLTLFSDQPHLSHFYKVRF